MVGSCPTALSGKAWTSAGVKGGRSSRVERAEDGSNGDVAPTPGSRLDGRRGVDAGLADEHGGQNNVVGQNVVFHWEGAENIISRIKNAYNRSGPRYAESASAVDTVGGNSALPQ